MTEKEYREHPAISRSELWKIRESPEIFKYYKENPEEPTPALIFGQAFHKLALQPESFGDEFAVMPQVDRRTKEGKAIWTEFCEQSEGKTVITEDDYAKATDMIDSLYKAPFVKKLLSGEKEKEFFWTDDLTGEACKCRADCVSELNKVNIIVDLIIVFLDIQLNKLFRLKKALIFRYNMYSAFGRCAYCKSHKPAAGSEKKKYSVSLYFKINKLFKPYKAVRIWFGRSRTEAVNAKSSVFRSSVLLFYSFHKNIYPFPGTKSD